MRGLNMVSHYVKQIIITSILSVSILSFDIALGQEEDEQFKTIYNNKYCPTLSSGQRIIDSLNKYLDEWPYNSSAYISRAMVYSYLGMYSAVEKELSILHDKKERDFTKGNIPLIRSWYLMLLGNYQDALVEIERAQNEIRYDSDELNAANTIYKIVMRLLQQNNLPPPQWKPDYTKYITKTDIYSPWISLLRDRGIGFIAGMFWEKQTQQDKPEGKIYIDISQSANLMASEPAYYSFSGSYERPIPFAPSFFVWNGSVINDKTYGVLITNGTRFRYVTLDGKYKVTRTGIVKDWKLAVLSESKDLVDHE